MCSWRAYAICARFILQLAIHWCFHEHVRLTKNHMYTVFQGAWHMAACILEASMNFIIHAFTLKPLAIKGSTLQDADTSLNRTPYIRPLSYFKFLALTCVHLKPPK